METFKEVLARCRLGNGPSQEDDPEDWDESGRDTRCAICRDEMCICGNCYDCEHDTDERHGWSPLTTEYLEDGRTRPWRNGKGRYVIKDRDDGRYIGRELDGGTPAIQCWPSRLTRHVMHFRTRSAAQKYIDDGKTGFPKHEHSVRRVRALKKVTK
jgi:hypothetical protein